MNVFASIGVLSASAFRIVSHNLSAAQAKQKNCAHCRYSCDCRRVHTQCHCNRSLSRYEPPTPDLGRGVTVPVRPLRCCTIRGFQSGPPGNDAYLVGWCPKLSPSLPHTRYLHTSPSMLSSTGDMVFPTPPLAHPPWGVVDVLLNNRRVSAQHFSFLSKPRELVWFSRTATASSSHFGCPLVIQVSLYCDRCRPPPSTTASALPAPSPPSAAANLFEKCCTGDVCYRMV